MAYRSLRSFAASMRSSHGMAVLAFAKECKPGQLFYHAPLASRAVCPMVTLTGLSSQRMPR